MRLNLNVFKMADVQTLNINGTAYDIFARGLYGYSYSVTVDGDKDTYYPVVISTTTSKRTPNMITISKNLGSKTASYPGNHDGGTASCLYRYEVRNQYWDGDGGYCKCLHAWYGYAQLVAEATMLGSAVGNFCIWLRGGGTLYNIYTTFASGATPYYSKTNVGSSTYPVYVEPRTTIGNAGQYSNTLLGYGSISGTATYASRLGDSSAYYTKASLDAALNGKSNTGHTHTKAQITDFPTIPTNTNQLTNGAGFITGITKSMVTTALGYTPPASDTNTWRGITDSYSGTATDTSLSQKGANSLYNALVNGHANTATDSSKLGGYSADTYFAYRGCDTTPGKDANTAMTTVMGSNFSYSNNCPNTGPLLTFNCGGYNLQINGGYSSNSGKNLSFRLRNGDNGTNHNWYDFIHSGNIGSQSVNYATSAGSASSIAWSGITGKPSTFAPATHTHNYLSLDGGTMNNQNVVTNLNADLLDGYSGSSYVRTSTNQTIAGTKTFSSKIVAQAGVTIGSTDDYGWYPYNNRICAGNSVARNVNVGSLLVSNAWADEGNVPTNGIWSKGDIKSNSGFYQTSDERLKTFYDPIKVDLDKLKKLRKNYFKFNDNDELQIGVSAQDVREIYPEIVSENGDGYLSVAYDKLSVIALAALDEQQKEIDDLKDQLSTIKNILKEKGIL